MSKAEGTKGQDSRTGVAPNTEIDKRSDAAVKRGDAKLKRTKKYKVPAKGAKA